MFAQCGALLYREIMNMARKSKKEAESLEYSIAEAETRYYNMLYDFACVVSKANEKSFEGETPEKIAKILKKSAAAFCNLCMIENLAQEKENKPVEEPQRSRKEAPEPKQEPVQPPERSIPDNFLVIDPDGWGLCPVCSGRVLKVTATTRLENFPVYCKRCRADHLVNWWNATNQRIHYKRYINDNHLRNQAIKGTGLRSFQNSGSSATERVAVKYG